ncbi:hypothetical protein GCM10009665_67110 [Kitasatospora nipponensis]|uniref:DUF1345 domain-containing protein n=1 Tax=Kitasatospora nipponensis TaxID=258049 RepID=A0ABP4HLN9_9ACTN
MNDDRDDRPEATERPAASAPTPPAPTPPAPTPPAPGAAPAPASGSAHELAELLHHRLDRIEALLVDSPVPLPGTGAGAAGNGEAPKPVWQTETEAEQRWAVTVVILCAIGLQFTLPARLSIHPRWLLPALEVGLLVALAAMNPHRTLGRSSRVLRSLSLLLVAAISLANGWSAVGLVRDLVYGHGSTTAFTLLSTGGAVWATNVIAFALWYWEWDRGGPAARARGTADYPDFLFPQMQQQDIAPVHWEPGFLDYLYVAYTNATAFSPTDTMPLSLWAKLLMMLQSVVSLLTVVLVVARAVNILQ